ncbi:hypothetical protein AK812_SmicGene27424 [Symbiodinium microadriaticum]|uniref:Uncharacterized protein n=1 Tax=Symbiodinium microadriaticum TaxID=2951 RepID=A0A1Q9D751_SYMMI|nr:hypothetical protein AK812_SmicGene27424 [Symbiodinium microadriaticum]
MAHVRRTVLLGLRASRHFGFRASTPRFSSLLSQLPDFEEGRRAVAEQRYADALPMLRRAAEVADAYFPPDAGAERAECHLVLGSCLWMQGLFAEAAQHFSGKDSEQLQFAAARTFFELGDFNQASALARGLKSSASLRTYGHLILGAVQVATGDGEAVSTDDLSLEAQCIAKLNELVGEALSEGAGAPPTAAKLTGSPLAQLVGLEEGDPEISAETRLVLRCTLGELAVHGGVDEPWVRQALVSALSDFDGLQPRDPTLRPFVFRALAALAGVTNQKGDAITAEGRRLLVALPWLRSASPGLYRTALDHVEKYKTSGQRAETWRSWVSEGLAKMLSEGRHAEQRKAEIHALQAEVKHSSTSARRWALLWVPPPLAGIE